VSISSNTLFHFAKKKEYLVNILTNEFCPRYFPEEFDILLNDLAVIEQKMAVPMVCFCDIPLSQISEHIEEYGRYGIGMTKEWGIRKGISPILYSIKDTILNQQINIIKNTLARGTFYDKTIDMRGYYNIYNFMMFIKPYKGISKKTSKEKTFYNEREWRYVPIIDAFGDKADLPEPFIHEIEKIDKAVLEMNHRKLAEEPYRLGFEPDDIKYIVISKENEIDDFIQEIRNAKLKYSQPTVSRLLTKIVSVEKINEDF
jgi:hypothetical protein